MNEYPELNIQDNQDPLDEVIKNAPAYFPKTQAFLDSLPPGVRKMLKKKLHKQRMEDFRNGKVKTKQ